MADAEGAAGAALLHEGHNQEGNSTDALLFVTVALFLGIFSRSFLRWTRLPYTALLLVRLSLGVKPACQCSGLTDRCLLQIWGGIDPNFFLSLLLPIIIFASAFSLHWHTLRQCVWQVLLLAGPGVIIGGILTALVAKFIFPYGWSWPQSLLFGSILAATDPVAVVALLREVGASRELRTVVEGESLANDGSAYVLFLLFQGIVQGQSVTGASVIKQLCQLSLGGPAVGLAFGLVVVFWLRFIYNDDMTEITMTIVAAFGAFIVGNDILGVSGVLAILILGIWMIAQGAHHISRQVEHPLRVVWEELDFIANTLIFVLVGVIIAGNIYQTKYLDSVDTIHGPDYGYAILLWVLLLVIRALMIALFYPILRFTGYSITWQKAVVMVWSGLRGAVGLALSLFVLFNTSITDIHFRVLVFFMVSMEAAISIVVQGSSMGLLLQVGLAGRLGKVLLGFVVHRSSMCR
eukprot:jgi/Astpho2/999/e_gw1.00016.116.1_t